MSIVYILSKIFPFLSLFMLFGCPSLANLSQYEIDKPNVIEEKMLDATEETKAQIHGIEEVSESRKIVAIGEDITEETEVNNRTQKLENTIIRLDSINESLDWKLIKNNLYLNNKNELGFQIDYVTEISSTRNYISHFCDTNTPLIKIIDTDTFKHIGSTFYKDKNNIYHYFNMAYGSRFSIYKGVDYNTFKVVGDHYAKDKNNIYGERAGIIDQVDYATFTSEKNAGPYAKDKNGYFFWDDLIMTHDKFYKTHKRKTVSVKEFSKLMNN